MRRSLSEVHRVLSELERLRKRRRVWGAGRIGARMSAAEEAVLRAEELDYREGGDNYRHWDYFWTNVFIGDFVSIDPLSYVVLGSYGESFARWADQRALGELIELHTNPPKIVMMADQEWELNHHLWDEEVGPTDPITHFFFFVYEGGARCMSEMEREEREEAVMTYDTHHPGGPGGQ